MDLENHYFSYCFKKTKNAYENRKAKSSLSYKDFNCCELMGFAYVRFYHCKFSKKSLNKRISKNTRISKNPVKTNKITTCWSTKITTKISQQDPN